MQKLYVLMLVLILISPLASSAQFAYNYLDNEVSTGGGGNGTNNTNSSDYWDTNIGSLGEVNSTQFSNNGGTLNLLTSWLTSFLDDIYCKLTGCTMEGDIDMDYHSINNIQNISYNGVLMVVIE